MTTEKKNYVANVLGDGILDEEMKGDAHPLRAGDEGVLILYGDEQGATVVVAAFDEDDAERRLLATFGDGLTLDDLQESTDQRPLSVAYTAGLVPESAYSLLIFDAKARPLLHESVNVVEGLIARMPDEVAAGYREGGPHAALALLDALMTEAAGIADADPERRYLVARFDVTDLSADELDALAGEVSAQAEASDEHPSVEMTSTVAVEREADTVARLRAAFEVAHDRSDLKLGDDDLDIYFAEVTRALGLKATR